LSQLQELYMADTTIGNEAIGILAQFPNLRKLRIARNQIDGSGIAELPKLKNLEELDLSECAQLFDDAMLPLTKMTKLKKLNLWRVNISDIGIEPLKGLTTLESLNLDNTRLGDDGMVYLSGLTNLTFMHLGSTQITDAGLVHLEGLKALKDLKVTRTAVTQQGIDKLKEKLPNTEIQLQYIEE
jgi:Leucine-rich repeat (LRR) protein